MYLWAFVLYVIQVVMVVRRNAEGRSAKAAADRSEPTARSGGYDPDAGPQRPRGRPPPAHPGAVAAALPALGSSGSRLRRGRRSKRAARGAPRPRRAPHARWIWQALAALLIAVVFAAAVAQARSVAPGVSADPAGAGGQRASRPRPPPRAHRPPRRAAGQVDDVQRTALADDAEGRRLLASLDRLSLAAAATR